MSINHKEKLLLALDGSERSKLTVEYFLSCKPFRAFGLVLFNVINKIPNSYYDLQREPKSIKIVGQALAWEDYQRKKIESYLEQEKKVLIQGGFTENDIEIKIAPRKKGIARDIIKEAIGGYTAMVLRRRGTTRLPLIMGSVASKVVERNDATPIIIAGRRPATDKVLIAIDGSPNAMRAAQFTGRMLAGHDIGIHLVSVVRGFSVESHGDSQEKAANKNLALSPDSMMEKISAAREQLIQAGVSSEQITNQVISGVRSRAEAIVAEAESQNCDTIIVGRRGHSRIDYFLIGSVSSKVIQLGREHAVWVIP